MNVKALSFADLFAENSSQCSDAGRTICYVIAYNERLMSCPIRFKCTGIDLVSDSI